MDVVFWSIMLLGSAGILYMLGFITGWNAAVKDQETTEYENQLEDRRKDRHRPF